MLITSILSSFLIGVMIISQPVAIESPTIRTSIAGLIFCIICIFGILAALFPKQCSTTFHDKKDTNFEKSLSIKCRKNQFKKNSTIFNIKIVHGHHTMCKEFSHHEFQILDKTFCLGCYGLLSGALLSLSAMISYLFGLWLINEYTFNFLVWFGIMGVNLGLTKPLLARLKQRMIRYLVEILFVFSIFVLLVTVDLALKNMMTDFYLILLSLYWLWTKITVTRWDHDKICSICGYKC
jgi:hypothetical protein